MGHVYRSLAYAQALEEKIPNAAIRFFMRGFPEGVTRVQTDGYPVTVLPSRPTGEDFGNAFALHPPEFLIVDTLGSSVDLLAAARPYAHTIVTVDDLEPSAGDTDIVVNGIVWGTKRLPNRVGRAQVYQGPEYVQLRDQFREANSRERTTSQEIEKILISTGGADERNFAARFMQSVQDLPLRCEARVIVGPAFREVAMLHDLAKRASGSVSFSIVENTSDMAGELASADLALLTGGTVMFESAACGTPAVVVCSYAHQLPQAQWFAEHGAVVNLGYFPSGFERDLATQTLHSLAGDVSRRARMSVAAKAIVDGRGLERFVHLIARAANVSAFNVCR